MENKLVFLHVSDIHLREEELSSGIELDHDLRNELACDLRRLRADGAFRTLNGVLLTGDVAFAGKSAEFESARDWLDSLREEFGFPEGGVWCVPGNHDVDRTAITRSELTRSVRNTVRDGGEDRAALRLHALLKDKSAHGVLLGPLRQYNDSFANGFQCATRCPNLSWSDSVPLSDEYEVAIHGLNSAVISDARDDTDTARLAIGTAQLNAIGRYPGVINVSLCHHPPRWLFDQRAVQDLLNSRATLQLFGHEHDSRIERIDDSIRVFAGALHPQRGESQWRPHFNLVALCIDERNTGKEMRIRVWPRTWDRTATAFRADSNRAESPHRSYAVPLPDPLPTEGPAKSNDPQPLLNAQPTEILGGNFRSPVLPEEDAPRAPRDVVYRFYKLPWIQRMRIAMKLGLCSNEDVDVDEGEMGKRVFSRARENKKLTDLAAAIDQGLSES